MKKIAVRRARRGLNVPDDAPALIRKCARAALTLEGVDFDCEVDVMLTDDAGIREINREQRGKDAATDVLSFPMYEYMTGAPPDELAGELRFQAGEPLLLGDMVLSVERARAQAEEYGHPFARECGYLTVHSVLHLLGYDHERGDEERALMRRREEAALALVGLERQGD